MQLLLLGKDGTFEKGETGGVEDLGWWSIFGMVDRDEDPKGLTR